QRGKELVDKGAISKLNFDQLEANYRTSLAALELARQELAYTELKAPFTGSIGQRDVENFEEIKSNQPIFYLQNVNQLDVAIDLPENLVRSLQKDEQDGNKDRSEKAALAKTYASFEGRAQEQFPLVFKEVATRADSQTQTFRVTFTMPQPDEFRVLPGMTASVYLDLSSLINPDTARWVPITAVVADSGLESQIWVLD
ncbi:MAG: efflux RND transporter periplasmic adaptor subunit, partial [Gammaproteobacteria bacterium]|nr:efflux RND transporter periplasmic adaptor subunit [Gammaproteobacteria bacterium]